LRFGGGGGRFYGGSFANLGYCVNNNGVVAMRGLVRSGTGTIMAAGQHPFPPRYQMLKPEIASTGYCRVDNQQDGSILLTGYIFGGANGFVGVNFRWFTD
jgi:hypothetical protein